MRPNEITHTIIGAAIEVHRELGPGKPESAYERALAHELGLRGLAYQAQKPVPVIYKGLKLECGYRLDLLVAHTVVVEVKSVELVHPIHRAQAITDLKLGGWRLALLLNFNVAVLKEGIERLVFGPQPPESEPIAVPKPLMNFLKPSSAAPALEHCDCGDEEAEELAREILASALEVHRELGPGLLPSAYEACLCHELASRRVPFERKRPLALAYKDISLPQPDEVELLVGGRVVVNSCALEIIERVQEARLLSQLRLGGWKLGLVLNFNPATLKEGIRRMVLSRVALPANHTAGIETTETR